jgi:hypothetical protein
MAGIDPEQTKQGRCNQVSEIFTLIVGVIAAVNVSKRPKTVVSESTKKNQATL